MACIARWMAASIRNSIILHCSFICGSSICISHFNKERRIRWRIQIWFDLSQVAILNYFLQMNLISFIWGYTQFWSTRHKKANAQNINPSSSTIFAGHKNDLQKSLFFLAMQEWAWLQDGHIIWLVLRDEIDLWHLQKRVACSVLDVMTSLMPKDENATERVNVSCTITSISGW